MLKLYNDGVEVNLFLKQSKIIIYFNEYNKTGGIFHIYFMTHVYNDFATRK